jgi:hypothetical protein
LGGVVNVLVDGINPDGSRAIFNPPAARDAVAARRKGADNVSYYQRQSARYGRGRRGSTSVADAWTAVFGDASAAAAQGGDGHGDYAAEGFAGEGEGDGGEGGYYEGEAGAAEGARASVPPDAFFRVDDEAEEFAAAERAAGAAGAAAAAAASFSRPEPQSHADIVAAALASLNMDESVKQRAIEAVRRDATEAPRFDFPPPSSASSVAPTSRTPMAAPGSRASTVVGGGGGFDLDGMLADAQALMARLRVQASP